MSSVLRRSEDKRWSHELISQMKGTPKEPVPGSGKPNLVAYSRSKENQDRKVVEYVPREPEEPEVRVNCIYKKDVEKYGATEGCPGCRALLNPFSRYRAKHTAECRSRMEAAMMESDAGAARVSRATERQAMAKAKEDESTKKTSRRRRVDGFRIRIAER